MSRELFEIEKGLSLVGENLDTGVNILFGAAAPGNDSGEQDAAPLGSLYVLNNGASSTLYQKKFAINALSDWEENGSSSASIGVWRTEKLSVLTDDTQGAGVRDIVANPFSDDDAPVLGIADFIVGEYIISDAAGTPILLEITAVANPNVTFAVGGSALAQDDTFIARNYLPDSPGGQEGQAIVNYNGSIMIKIGDVDWDFATGINLSSGYAAVSGDITSADSVESAIEKLDGNVDAVNSAAGIAQGASDMGTYTGALLNDNESAKQNIQQLEIAIEGLETSVGPANIAQNTPTVVDIVLVDDCQYVEWEVTAHDIGDPTKVKKAKVSAFHNGHAGADATVVKDNVFDRSRIGGAFNLKLNAVISGVGAAQTMGLEIDTSDADGIRYSVRRTCVASL